VISGSGEYLKAVNPVGAFGIAKQTLVINRLKEGTDRLVRDLQSRWQETVEQGGKDVEGLAGKIETVRAIQVGSLDTPAELQQAVASILDSASEPH